jgi:hypothetical protein
MAEGCGRREERQGGRKERREGERERERKRKREREMKREGGGEGSGRGEYVCQGSQTRQTLQRHTSSDLLLPTRPHLLTAHSV